MKQDYNTEATSERHRFTTSETDLVVAWLLPIFYLLVIFSEPLLAAIRVLSGSGRDLSILVLHIPLALVSLLAILRCFSGHNGWHVGKLGWLLVLFWYMVLFRMVWDLWFAGIETAWTPEKFSWMVIVYTIIPMLAASAVANRSMLIRIHKTLLVFALALCPITLFITLGGGRADTQFRLQSDLFNSIAVGHFGTTCFLLGLVSIYAGTLKWRWRTIGAALMVFGTILTALAAARGPILALAIVSLLWLGLNITKRRNRFITFISVFIGLGLFGAFSARVEEQTLYRPLSRFEVPDGSSQSESEARIYLIESAWNVFLEHPVFGGSLVEPISRSYPHNAIVESLMAVGSVGTIALVLIFVQWIAAAVKGMHNQHEFAWLSVIFLQYILGSMFSGSIIVNAKVWALGIGMYSISRRLR